MGRPQDPTRGRRLLAGASLGLAALTFAVLGLREHDFAALRWGLAGVGALTGLAALGATRARLLPQVLSRGMGWIGFVPAAASVGSALWDGRAPTGSMVMLAGSTAVALAAGRAGLRSPAAMREFDPVRYRGGFLAGAVAAAFAGLIASFFAGGEWIWGSLGSGLELAALGAVLLSVSVGVVRMRSWGVLLGALTSVVMLGVALLARNEDRAVMAALATLPGVLLVVPLLRARLEPALATPGVAAATARVALRVPAEGAEDPGLRVRVDSGELTDDTGRPLAASQQRA